MLLDYSEEHQAMLAASGNSSAQPQHPRFRRMQSHTPILSGSNSSKKQRLSAAQLMEEERFSQTQLTQGATPDHHARATPYDSSSKRRRISNSNYVVTDSSPFAPSEIQRSASIDAVKRRVQQTNLVTPTQILADNSRRFSSNQNARDLESFKDEESRI